MSEFTKVLVKTSNQTADTIEKVIPVKDLMDIIRYMKFSYILLNILNSKKKLWNKLLRNTKLVINTDYSKYFEEDLNDFYIIFEGFTANLMVVFKFPFSCQWKELCYFNCIYFLIFFIHFISALAYIIPWEDWLVWFE